MKYLALAAMILLTACENPRLGVGASISGSGVNVSPVLSGDVGPARVALSPS